jgi:hypothetical protein
MDILDLHSIGGNCWADVIELQLNLYFYEVEPSDA